MSLIAVAVAYCEQTQVPGSIEHHHISLPFLRARCAVRKPLTRPFLARLGAEAVAGGAG